MIHVSLSFLVFLPFLIAGMVFAWAHVRMALHETAHCLAAHLVKFCPLEMEWGSGEKGWRFRFLGVPVIWHAQPWNGITHFQPASLRGFRWRGSIYILAGTAVDIALLLLIAWVNRHAEFTYAEPPLWYWFTKPLFFAQGSILLFTLLPSDLQIDVWKSATDGKLLFKYLTGIMAREVQADREEYLNVMRRYQPDFTFEQSWLHHPDLELVRLNLRALAAAREGRLEEALQGAEEVLARAPMAPGERAQVLDGMASAAGLSGKRWDLERALAWAREAHVLAPTAHPVQGTLGALLVEMGTLPEAIALLHPLATTNNDTEQRIHACCHLAKASEKNRDRAEAHRWLEKARAIKPDHPLITHVEAELGMSPAEG